MIKQRTLIIVSLLYLLLPSMSVFAGPETEVPVLMYHHFSFDQQDSLTVHPDDFKDQLLALKEAGYTTISDQDLIDYRHGKKDALPEKPILLTMDDGYLSNYELAFPILDELEMKATLFIIVERRDHGNEKHFSWEQAREMLASGLITCQTHTYDHHDYIEPENGGEPAPMLVTVKEGESREQYKARIEEDLALSITRIEEELGEEVLSFAAPYGVLNKQAKEVARTLGVELFYTVKPKINTEKNLKKGVLHRINVPGGMNGEELVKMLQ
ncbi:polysaccharide deacetylase family protein [Alkalihalobacillus oceani]|uniref:polysaccharide deacetylase family protein n=1 Tax=Halalkalibacter oceani TaxID=1653776 RepID=UPI00203DCBF2|nr:polysaccharide deacetylase family protein [Halalkalibacter oceani]MCM3762895.1 polysaccharide deacetylase family protein [Halalkalibacter oceani]